MLRSGASAVPNSRQPADVVKRGRVAVESNPGWLRKAPRALGAKLSAPRAGGRRPCTRATVARLLRRRLAVSGLNGSETGFPAFRFRLV